MPEPKSDDELKQIAVDLYDQKIFCDRYCESLDDVMRVFLPIALGALADMKKEEIENIGLIYEYYSEAGPRGINGKPCFFSCKLLTKSEYDTMFKYHEEYKKLKEQFIKKENGN